LRRLDGSRGEELDELGASGARYAAANSDWPSVVERLLTAVGLRRKHRDRGARIDQVVQTLEYGDAISDYALHVRRHLRELGYGSTIWVEGAGPGMTGEAAFFEANRVATADAVIYHHSIGSAIADRVAVLGVPKALVYHNITPAGFFAAYRPSFAELLQSGRDALPALCGKFDLYVVDSDYNALDLHEHGIAEARTIPVPVDFARFDVMPELDVLGDDAPGMRWLFVGRVAPNKGIRALIEALDAYRQCDGDVKLTIVGRFDPDDPYYHELTRLVMRRGLERHVTFAGVVTNRTLHAHYRRADVFVTLSEHEGFCVPVVEAMFFDLPVVALAATALPETLGAAGLLVERTADAAEIAALIHCLRTDSGLSARLLEAQRMRRRDFLPDQIYPHVERLVLDLTG
jgi:glycosyltransferase involved in cell wall biosynthesis